MNGAINPNYVNLMFSPHKAFRMVCWIYEYECMNFYEPCMRERVRTCFVEHHILSYKSSRRNIIIRNMQHGNNIYLMPNGFMLSIGKENIYIFSLEMILSISLLICIQSQLQLEMRTVNIRMWYRSYICFDQYHHCLWWSKYDFCS